LIVRSRELHCRKGWGHDRWDIAADDVVLDIRVRQPDGDGGFRQPTMMTSNEQRSLMPTAESIISAWSTGTAVEAGIER
jgi:hypothetical protein